MDWKVNSTLATLLLLITIICTTCSSSDDSPVEVQQESKIDPALVGSWVGTIDGGLGEANIEIELKGDGTMSGEGANSPYCALTAKWEVVGSSFKAKGNDSCDGTAVSFSAPYSKTKLTGSWNASSGNSGTFSVIKQ